ncbi:MAG: hypothetical protein AAFY88_25405, partial [Acidobacteriota bacterium]
GFAVALAGVFALVHLVFAPLALARSAESFRSAERYFTGQSSTLPNDPSESVVLVSAPNFYLASLAPVAQAARGEALPADLLTLATGVYGVEVERLDARTLRVRPDGGFLLPPGQAPPGQVAPAASFLHFLQTADQLYRRLEPFTTGERIRRGEVIIEVVEVTPDGRPATVDFRFPAALEERRWIRFVEWRGYEPWPLPDVGGVARIEALGASNREGQHPAR